jgi:hypothetical protein
VATAPSEVDIDRLESAIQSTKCIGWLDRWERHYFFRSKPAQAGGYPHVRIVDESQIEFIYRQAGFAEFQARRLIHGDGSTVVAIDDRPYLYASGSYDVKSGRAALKYCGSNV